VTLLTSISSFFDCNLNANIMFEFVSCRWTIQFGPGTGHSKRGPPRSFSLRIPRVPGSACQSFFHSITAHLGFAIMKGVRRRSGPSGLSECRSKTGTS
jgi:hypothetical protein